MTHGTLTQAALDALFAAVTVGLPPHDGVGRPKFTLIVSRRTSSRIEQGWLRGFKRRARRKALKRQFK